MNLSHVNDDGSYHLPASVTNISEADMEKLADLVAQRVLAVLEPLIQPRAEISRATEEKVADLVLRPSREETTLEILCRTVLETKHAGEPIETILKDPEKFELHRAGLEKRGVTLTRALPGPRTCNRLDDMLIFLQPTLMKNGFFKDASYFTRSAITAIVKQIPGAGWQQRTIDGDRDYGAVVDPAEFYRIGGKNV